MVDRFNPNYNPATVQGMNRHDAGAYVRYSDYEALRARLETVEAETIERAVKRVKADKDIQGLVKARIFIALRNLEPRHD